MLPFGHMYQKILRGTLKTRNWMNLKKLRKKHFSYVIRVPIVHKTRVAPRGKGIVIYPTFAVCYFNVHQISTQHIQQHTTHNIHHIKQHTTNNLQHTSYKTTYNIQHTTYNIQHKTYNIQHTTNNIQHTTYNIQHTTYNIHHIKQHTTQHTTHNIQHKARD